MKYIPYSDVPVQLRALQDVFFVADKEDCYSCENLLCLYWVQYILKPNNTCIWESCYFCAINLMPLINLDRIDVVLLHHHTHHYEFCARCSKARVSNICLDVAGQRKVRRALTTFLNLNRTREMFKNGGGAAANSELSIEARDRLGSAFGNA